MKRWAQTLDDRRKWRIFGTWFALDAILALFPPVYWVAGSASLQGPVPLSLIYVVGTAVVISASVMLFQFVQSQRGELD